MDPPFLADIICEQPLTEKEIRAMEESVLQKIFHTKRICSRHLLYLEADIIPERCQIHRYMINFRQYVLQQPTNSIFQIVFRAQKANPRKGVWVSNVCQLLITYNINLTLQEVQHMKTSLFKNLVKRKVHTAAFISLI